MKVDDVRDATGYSSLSKINEIYNNNSAIKHI